MMNNEATRVPPETENTPKKPNIGIRLLRTLTHNWAWKLLCLVLAICLWGALITQDTSLPRDKIIEDVRVTVSNAAILRTNGLIVVSDLDALEPVRLRARVPQRNYTTVTSSNYIARLDLSQIQAPGEQTVEITAAAANSSQYGTVEEIYNPTVTLMVEEYGTIASIPVEVRTTGALPDSYYATPLSRSVEAVDISGPLSVVEKAARCVVIYDLSGLSPERSPNTISLPFYFEDADGNQLDDTYLTVTAHGQTAALQRITVIQDVYLMAQVPVAVDALIKGEPAEGYAVSSVRVTPQTVLMAGIQSDIAPYLNGDTQLYPYEQVDITGQSRTVSQLLYLNTPGNMEYISNTSVQVVVSILPEEFVNMSPGADTEQNP